VKKLANWYTKAPCGARNGTRLTRNWRLRARTTVNCRRCFFGLGLDAVDESDESDENDGYPPVN